MQNLSQVLEDLKKRTKKESQTINETLNTELNALRASLREKINQEKTTLENDIASMTEAYRLEMKCHLEKAKRSTIRQPWWVFLSVLMMSVIVIFITFLWETRMMSRMDTLKTEVERLQATRVRLDFPTVTYQGAEYIRVIPEPG